MTAETAAYTPPAQVRRSLRPGKTYRTRSGRPAEILSFDGGGEFPLLVRITDEALGTISGARTRDGLHPASKGDHPHDILEVNEERTLWVVVYDTPPANEEGKVLVGGKKNGILLAKARLAHWYGYETEEEAKGNLNGARAVFPVTYSEGQGLL